MTAEESIQKAVDNVKKPPGTKFAWLYVFASHPWTIGWNDGDHAFHDLYFSSPEKFRELWGRPLDDQEALIKVWVPEDFTNWDYVPIDY